MPSHKLFGLSYNDLITKPDAVAQKLLRWLPELESLDISKNFLKTLAAKGQRERPVSDEVEWMLLSLLATWSLTTNLMPKPGR